MSICKAYRKVKNTRKNPIKNIENLENDILQIENIILKFSQIHEKELVKKSIDELRSDLKYLAVLANGAEIDKIEFKKTMNFLREHYNYLQEQSAHFKTLS